MSIATIHTAGLNLFQSLIPKTATIKFPSDTTNSNLKNKVFTISQISCSGISDDRLKNMDSNFSGNAIEVTILIDILSATKDRTATINAPLYGYKDSNAIVRYKSKDYVVKEEFNNPFENSITLMCDTKA